MPKEIFLPPGDVACDQLRGRRLDLQRCCRIPCGVTSLDIARDEAIVWDKRCGMLSIHGCIPIHLRCADRSYYVGGTRASLEERVVQHHAGTFGGYTARRRPVTLVFHQEFGRIDDAIASERQIKNWSRAKKEALIRGDFVTLHELAKGRS